MLYELGHSIYTQHEMKHTANTRTYTTTEKEIILKTHTHTHDCFCAE